MTSAQVPCCRPYPSPSPSPSPSPNPSPNQVPSGRPSSLTPPAACAASTSKHPLARVRARARAGAGIGGGLGWKGGGEGGVSAWLGTEERPRRRSGAPSPLLPLTSTVAGRAVPGQLGGPPRRLSTTPQRLAFPPAREPLHLSYTHPGAGRRSTSSSASGSSTSRTTLGACCATLSGSGARTGFRSEALLSSQSFHREQGTACRRAARRRGGAWRLLSDSIV